MEFAWDTVTDNYTEQSPQRNSLGWEKEKKFSTQFAIKICTGICLKNVLITERTHEMKITRNGTIIKRITTHSKE